MTHIKFCLGDFTGKLFPVLTGLMLFGLTVDVIAAAAPDAAQYTAEVRVRHFRTDGTDTVFNIEDGAVLRSGDEFQVRLETQIDAYLYVLIHSSSGNAEVLHPFSRRPGKALISKGEPRIIPGESGAFSLDENTGTETIYILASAEPFIGLQRLLDRIERAGQDRSKVIDVIQSTGLSFKKIEFKHVDASLLSDLEAASGLRSGTGNSSSSLSSRSGSFFREYELPDNITLTRSDVGEGASAETRSSASKPSGPPRFDRLFGGSKTSDPAAKVVLSDVGSRIDAIFNPVPEPGPGQKVLEQLAIETTVESPPVSMPTVAVDDPALTSIARQDSRPVETGFLAPKDRQISIVPEVANARLVDDKSSDALDSAVLSDSMAVSEAPVVMLAEADIQAVTEVEIAAVDRQQVTETAIEQTIATLPEPLEENPAEAEETIERIPDFATTEAVAVVQAPVQVMAKAPPLLAFSEPVLGASDDAETETVAVADQAPEPVPEPEPELASAPTPAFITDEYSLDSVVPAPAVESGIIKAMLNDPTVLAQLAKEAIVKVVTPNHVGAGAIISASGDILTHWHTIKGRKRVIVVIEKQTEDGRTERKAYDAKVVHINKESDLALLNTTQFGKEVNHLAVGLMDSLAVGQSVTVTGFRSGAKAGREGILFGIKDQFSWYAGTNIIHSGQVILADLGVAAEENSVVLNHRNELVGLTAFSGKGTGRCYAISAQAIHAFIARR